MIRRRSLAALAGALMITVAGAAGCGDDDSALSADEFVSQANAICAEGNARIGAAVPKGLGQGPPSGAEGRAFYDAIVNESDGIVAGLGALEAPKEMQADVRDLLDAARAAIDDIRRTSPADFFASDEDPFDEVDAKARAMGLEDCGSE